jgi:hypothetical protein
VRNRIILKIARFSLLSSLFVAGGITMVPHSQASSAETAAGPLLQTSLSAPSIPSSQESPTPQVPSADISSANPLTGSVKPTAIPSRDGTVLRAGHYLTAAVAGTPLAIPFISQFPSGYMSLNDCGPASIAMVLSYLPYYRRASTLPDDATFLTQIRSRALVLLC